MQLLLCGEKNKQESTRWGNLCANTLCNLEGVARLHKSGGSSDRKAPPGGQKAVYTVHILCTICACAGLAGSRHIDQTFPPCS